MLSQGPHSAGGVRSVAGKRTRPSEEESSGRVQPGWAKFRKDHPDREREMGVKGRRDARRFGRQYSSEMVPLAQCFSTEDDSAHWGHFFGCHNLKRGTLLASSR